MAIGRDYVLALGAATTGGRPRPRPAPLVRGAGARPADLDSPKQCKDTYLTFLRRTPGASRRSAADDWLAAGRREDR
jgi:hypothetical protein